MKKEQILHGKTYTDGKTKRSVVKIFNDHTNTLIKDQLSVMYHVEKNADSFRFENRKTITLTAFAKWAKQEVA